MKTLIPSLFVGVMMIFTSAAFASCPLNMEEEKLIECLTIEGSGENYQDYQQKFEEELADMADESAKSVVRIDDEEC